MSGERTDAKRRLLIQAALAVFACYFYVLMEWLFFFTKRSFLSGLGLFDALRVMSAASVPVMLAGTALVVLCTAPALVIRNGSIGRAWSNAGLTLASLVLAASFFLLIDNFTYTILRFGARNVHGIWKLSYVLLLVTLVAVSYTLLEEIGAKIVRPRAARAAVYAAAGIVLASVIVSAAAIDYGKLGAFEWERTIIPLENRPNIIVLSGDGLDADHMSVYGYRRDTTPFLREIADDVLLSENCFVNADASGGSIASMFTGKLPTQTRLLFPPDILRGEDAYRHLPGLLKQYGYRNMDASVRHHADPVDMNMQNSFDWVNRREIREHKLADLTGILIGGKTMYFIGRMYERLTQRLFHVFGVRGMEDPMAEVSTSRKEYRRDVERINDLYSFMDASSDPFFAHLHLLGTHGPTFTPVKQVFSEGKKESGAWRTDFYDDSILQFDAYVREIMQRLREKRVSYNTIVIICTDHGQRWKTNVRVPLIFVFPYGGHSGRITANVQNLDIAPTILDYLEVEQPEWMGGRSLLSSDREADRFLFTVNRLRGAVAMTPRGREMDKRKVHPPFYSMGSVGIFFRQRLYELDLEQGTLTVDDIEGHTVPCPEADLPDPQDVGQMIIDHLAGNGYDVSSLKGPFTVLEPEDQGGRDTHDQRAE